MTNRGSIKKTASPFIYQSPAGRGKRDKTAEAINKTYEEVNKATTAEMYELAKTVARTANRRYESAIKAGGSRAVIGAQKKYVMMLDPAGDKVEVTSERFRATKKMTRNELYRVYRQARSYLEMQTSTRAGYNEWKRNVTTAVFRGTRFEKKSPKMTDEQMKRFWSVYNRFEEMYPSLKHDYGSEDTLQEVARAYFSEGWEGRGVDEQMDIVNNRLLKFYEDSVEKEAADYMSGLSSTEGVFL